MPSDLALITFPGAPNLPVFAARGHGMFEDEGVRVRHDTTPSSTHQVERLVAGEYDVAGTAFDNVVAYQENEGAVALAAEPDLFVAMGATRIELSLVVASEIETYADLRGRSIALDAVATGFAFVLYEMLARAGLDPGDVHMVPVGATPQRWQSVRDGEHAGTLTIEPFTSVAVAGGFRVLDTSTDAFEHYQGGIFAARRAWAADHGDALAAFVRGYLRGLSWTLDAANRDAAEALLLRNMPQMTPGVAGAVMEKLLSPRTGLTPAAALDREGMRTVLDLRTRYGPSGRRFDDPNRYVDLSCYRRARSGRIQARRGRR